MMSDLRSNPGQLLEDRSTILRHSLDRYENTTLISGRSPMEILLANLIHDADMRYQPKLHTELDLTEFAHQARILQDLWEMDQEYARVKQTKEVVRIRDTLLGAVDELGRVIYPWISENGRVGSVVETAAHAKRGRGIVIACGKGQTRVITHLLAILRHYHHSKLPVEIIYHGENDLPKENRDWLEAIGPDIKCVDIEGLFGDKDNQLGMPGGWAIRPFAILGCSFRHAMLIDADAVLLTDPDIFFEQPQFAETGNYFWHDRNLGPTGNDKYDWVDNMLNRLGVDNRDELKFGSEWFTRKNGHEMER